MCYNIKICTVGRYCVQAGYGPKDVIKILEA